MALIPCKECKAQVSDQAGKCPHCGAKVDKPTSKIALVFAGLVLIGVVKCSYESATQVSSPAPPPLTAEQRAAKEKKEADFQRVVIGAKLIKNATKNPDSFKLESAVMMDDGSICYEYRGTNSFNAIVPGTMVINAKVSSNSAADWNRYCAGKTGVDFSYARQAL